MDTIRGVFWLTVDEISAVSMKVANCLDSNDPSITAEHRGQMMEIGKEFGVAKTRYETGPIPAKNLRAALGKPAGTIPVRMSRQEVHALMECAELPISILDKLFYGM